MIPSLPKINKLSFSNSVSKSVNSSEPATLWTPLDLNLGLSTFPQNQPAIWGWFRADVNTDHLSNGENVEQWVGYSTSSAFANAVMTRLDDNTTTPTFETNIYNGKPAIGFQGNDALEYVAEDDSITEVGEAASQYETYYVIERTNSSNPPGVEVFHRQGGLYEIAFASSNNLYTNNNQWDKVYLNGVEISSPYSIAQNITNNGANILRLTDTSYSNTNFLQSTFLGANNENGDIGWTGYLAEYLMFARQGNGFNPRPIGDEQKIEGYLAHKYGIQSKLPSDHPYKSAAPTT